MAPAWEGKRYKLVSSDNFDAYMQTVGVGLVQRKLGLVVSSTMEVSKDGDEYVMRQTSKIRDHIFRFRPGVEFIEETPDGRKVKTVYRWEGENKLVQENLDGVPNTVVREFTETEYIATLTVKDIVCVRKYVVDA